jgi:hypothetical protein
MTDLHPVRPGVAAAPALLERVSWGAVIAGAVIALAILTVLNLIGLAFGLYAVDASSQNLGAGAAGTVAGIWWAISALIALFIGGWISGRLAGSPETTVAAIHGAAVWAGATLLAVFMVSSAVGAAFTGAAGLVGRAAQTAGQTVSVTYDAVDPVLGFAADALTEELRRNGVAVEPARVREEAGAVINQAISPQERQELQTLAQQAAAGAIQNPATARTEFRTLIDRAVGPNGVIGPEDRAQAVTALSQRLGVPEDQIRTTIDNWQAQFATGPEIEARIAELQTQAAQTTEETAGTIANAAMWTALGLILALLAAVFGGTRGRAKTIPAGAALYRGEPLAAGR